MENFAAIAKEFRDAGALFEIGKADELESTLDVLFADPKRRAELGERAFQLADGKRGVTAHAVSEILAAHDWAVPSWHIHGIAKIIAGGFSLLWRGGGRLKRADARPLSTPVISVGGIAMGGTGKTPFVQMLARHLRDSGRQPAILTRGYRRKSLARMIVIEAGRSVPTVVTGDEAQIFVRAGVAHIGICSDRWTVGREMEERSRAGIFLLDDGFQHRRLKRDVDLVLIDALDPFAGGAVFPRGRLREPLTALSRAHAFVITRAQPGRRYSGIRARLRELNPSAPVFLSTLEPKYWVPGSLDGQNVVAFCGLGNPDGFWNTLHRLGIDPVFRWTFPDHHIYRPREIQRLAAQARKHAPGVLLTTKKDVMNLPDYYGELIAPVELLWLEVEAKVENERDLFDFIERAVATVPRRSSPEISPLGA
jgi:tetraacyldisaccharide 4'-kinase